MSRLLLPEEVEKFKQQVEEYELHDDILQTFLGSNFAIIAGPAGAGKDTLRDALLKIHPDIYLPILSTTTRPMRPGEVEGETYYYTSVEAFSKGLHDKQFFMAEVVHNQQISGLHADEIRKLRQGQWGLSILITRAERKLSKIKPDIKTLFIVPPSFDILKQRMNAKRTLSEDELQRRLLAARQELRDGYEASNYFCIVSDNADAMVAKAHPYLVEGSRDNEADAYARHCIADILNAIDMV
jgi:guanylate kinase